MVATLNKRNMPLGLAVSGEAEAWLEALDLIVGPGCLATYKVNGEDELIEVVRAGLAHAAVLDEDVHWRLDVLQMLKMVHRLDATLPVVVVTRRQDRRWLESALRLAAFSVVCKPLEFEERLRQIQRSMVRLDAMLREDPDR